MTRPPLVLSLASSAPLLRSSTKKNPLQHMHKYYHHCNKNASYTTFAAQSHHHYRRSGFIISCSSYNLCQQFISLRQYYYGGNNYHQHSIIAAPSSIMSTSATTVRTLSLLSMSKNDGNSMRKKLSTNRHLNLFSTLKSYAVEKTITIDTQSADDDCTDKSSSGNNESKSSVLEHYESLVNSGEVSKDIHQIRALTELDRLREDCLSYINSPLFHESATDNDDIGSGSGNVGSGGGWSISTSLFSSWGFFSKVGCDYIFSIKVLS